MYLVPFPDKKDVLDIPCHLVLYDSKAQQAALNNNVFDVLKLKYSVNLCHTENSKKTHHILSCQDCSLLIELA